MKPKTGCQWVLFLLEVLILPIFALVAYILNSISSFQNINSFKDRPTYVFDIKPSDPKDDYVYVLGQANCSTAFDADLVKFVNDLETGYYIFLFVFCFIFCTCSLIGNTIFKIGKWMSDSPTGNLKGVNLASTVFTYLSFVFSVPCLYATKIEYDDCLKIEGILTGFVNHSMMLFCNIGMWFLLVIAAYTQIRKIDKVRQFEKNFLFKLVLGVMGIYIVMFLIMALVTKFGSVLSFQIGWDISLSLNFATGVASVKFNDWNVAKIKPFS